MIHNYYTNYYTETTRLPRATNFTTILTAKSSFFFSTREEDNLTDENEERSPNYAALYTKR